MSLSCNLCCCLVAHHGPEFAYDWATLGNTFQRVATLKLNACSEGTALKRRPSRMERIAEASARALAYAQAHRGKNPHLFIDAYSSEVLYVENVAELLGASVGTIRRIPQHQLPRKKIGRRVVYLRTDVDEYVRLVIRPKPLSKRAGNHAARVMPPTTSIAGPDFNPTEFVRKSLGDKK